MDHRSVSTGVRWAVARARPPKLTHWGGEVATVFENIKIFTKEIQSLYDKRGERSSHGWE